MKKSVFFLLCSGIVLFLSSCKTVFYQVYKTESTSHANKQDGRLFFEDAACKVSYNLWDEGGNVGFCLFNKTDENIYVDLGESFFILNGIAYDYYKNRVYSESNTSSIQRKGRSELYRISKGNNVSVSRNESRVICIPANTSKMIFEYKVSESLYHDCDMLLYTSRSKIKSINFTRENSPCVFSNRISYRIGESKDLTRMDNEFYVTQITNYPVSEMTYTRFPSFCGERSLRKQLYLREGEPNEFYIEYRKVAGGWKH